MPRITKAQEIENARIAKNDRSALRIAQIILISLLLVSTGFNALSATLSGFDPIALIIGVVPPLVLFALSLLLERLELDRTVKVGLSLSILTSLIFSWVHIASVVLHYSHSTNSMYYVHIVIAWSFPIILDVPMLLAGKSIMTIRNRQTNQITTSATNTTTTTSTTNVPKSANTTKPTITTKPAKRTSPTNAPKTVLVTQNA